MPDGICFETMDEVRHHPFYLKILGDDWWKIDSYAMFGKFAFIPDPLTHIDDLGWVEMARLQTDVELSSDDAEGSRWHEIEINGSLYYPMHYHVSIAPQAPAGMRV